MELIGAVAPKDAAIVDVGGGASLLVDRLLDAGYSDLTVVDVSARALEHARRRLGPRAAAVRWLEADARALSLPAPADVWHDRAVFHFLTNAADREAYVRALLANLRAGGHAVIATFALDGPRKCSGLDVARYDARTLSDALGPAFRLLRSLERTHVTPAGVEQRFTYATFRREAPAIEAIRPVASSP